MYTYLDISNPTEEVNIEIEHSAFDEVCLKFGQASVNLSKKNFDKLCKKIAEDKAILPVAGKYEIVSRFKLKSTFYSNGEAVYILLPKKSQDINERIIMEHIDLHTGEVLHRSFEYDPRDGYYFDFNEGKWFKDSRYSALANEALFERNKALKECGALTAHAVSEIYDEQLKQLEEFPFEF